MNTKCVLLVSPNPSLFEQALAPFTKSGFSVKSEASLESALPLIEPAAPPSLVLLDASRDPSGENLRRDAISVLSRCALTYLAAVSPISGKAFHDAMEGLGMLPPLPVRPTEKDGERLLNRLRRFLPEI